MIPPLQSLVKYDNQVLVSTVKDKRIKEKGKANKVRGRRTSAETRGARGRRPRPARRARAATFEGGAPPPARRARRA